MRGCWSSSYAHRSAEAGVAISEFVLVFPAFLMLMLLVIEIALLRIDRHLLKLATVDAGRAYAQRYKGPGTNPCGTEQTRREVAQVVARRVAAVAPTMASVLRDAGIRLEGEGAQLLSGGGDENNRFVRAGLRVLAGLPAALAMTGVRCRPAGEAGVAEIEVVWRRPPRMPFAGTALWVIHLLREANSRLDKNVLQFDLDRNFHGIEASSPQVDRAREEVQRIAETLGDISQVTQKMATSLASAEMMMRKLPGGDRFAEYFETYRQTLGQGEEAVRHAQAQVGAKAGQIDHQVDQVLRPMGVMVTKILYSIPNLVRTIPLVERTRWAVQASDGRGTHWEDGQGLLVAPLVNGTDKSYDKSWVSWARAMVQEKHGL